MKIIVLGAGAWGTAMAISAARHPDSHAVTLWARSAEHAVQMQAARSNARYLPGVGLPQGLEVRSGTVPDAVAGAGLVVVATPMAALRGMLGALHGCTAPVAWLCKGFEAALAEGAPGLLAHEVHAQVAPGLRAGVLVLIQLARVRPHRLLGNHTNQLQLILYEWRYLETDHGLSSFGGLFA